ncbi:hypothetical protein MRX96_020380 [Rhipicephalus microplus]
MEPQLEDCRKLCWEPSEHKPNERLDKQCPERSRVGVVPWRENLVAFSLRHSQSRFPAVFHQCVEDIRYRRMVWRA